MNEKFFSKERSKIIYGIAISLMLIHHLFAFPDRIHYDYYSVLNFSFLGLENLLAYFGKFCVAIYAFISGYVICLSLRKTYDIKKMIIYVVKRLSNFYKRYWVYLILFVPIGFILGVYTFDFKELIKNFIGISSSYNAEWWYVKQYVKMMLCSPLLLIFIRVLKKYLITSLRFLIYILLYILVSYGINVMLYPTFLVYLMCFISGMIVYEENIFYHFNCFIKSNYLSIVILTILFLVRTFIFFNNKFDYLLVPFFIYSLLKIMNIEWIEKILHLLFYKIGLHSQTIYFIHTFFIYYYFQKLVFLPYYSILIFLWAMILCTVVSYFMNILIFNRLMYKKDK